MDVMRHRVRDDGLLHYWMDSIEVDGIYGSCNKEFGYQFFTIKFNSSPWEEGSKNGYLDDRDGLVFWDSPYSPWSYKYGEMDMDLYLRTGVIKPVGFVEEF